MDGEGEELGLLGGDDGEDGGGDEGGGGGGEELELVGGPEGGGEGGEKLPPGEEETPPGDEGGGGRAIVKVAPLEVRKAIREITTTNPEFAKKFPAFEKTVTTALFKSNQITQLGGLQRVNEALETLEIHGGTEGIQALADEVEAGRLLEQGFKEGDPKIIDGWVKDYPAGFKKLVLPAVDKLAEVDKDRYAAVTSYIADRLLSEYGVLTAFAALGEALATLEAGKDGGSIKKFNEIVKFLGDMKTIARGAKSDSSGTNAELDEERENLAKSRREMIYAGARSDVNPQIKFEVNRLIRLALPRGKKVRVEYANRLRAEIEKETRVRMNSESDFSSSFETLLAKGNKERLANFIFTRAKKHLPRVVKQLLGEFGLTGGKGSQDSQQRRTGGGSGTNGRGEGSRVIVGRPKTSEIDFARTDKAVWLSTMNSHGTAWLLSGKQAKW